MKKIKIEFTNERIIPASGLAVVGAILGKCDFVKRCNRMDVTPNRSQHQIKNGDVLLTYIGLLTMGKPAYESVHEFDGVSRTYKGYDGYAPIMAYIGTEGYLANCELREGKQHCQKNTPEFLRETIRMCREITDEPLLIRLDSGNDAAENIGILVEAGCHFIIKRNLRKESKEDWLKMAQEHSKDVETPRDGKTVYIGSDWKPVSYKPEDGEEKNITLRTGYEIINRTIDKYGQFLLEGDTEVNTWWTNLGMTDREVIGLYHAHGECEQFHSEIKTDMDVERLPSGKFETNELVLELTILAYNILRMIGQESIGRKGTETKHKVRRRRLRTVIGNMIMMASHVTEHARQLLIGLGRSNIWRHAFAEVYTAFADFQL